jgi:hypothetical protein
MLICKEKDNLKEARKKLANEIEAEARASAIDRENMKRSISEKRAQDSGSLDEYSDISNDELDDEQNEPTSNTTRVLDSPLSISQSRQSSSTPLSRSYTLGY